MVNAPIILTTATHPLHNNAATDVATAGTLPSDVSAIVQTDVDTSILNITTNTILIADNPSADQPSAIATTNATNDTHHFPAPINADECSTTTIDAATTDSINNNNNNSNVQINGSGNDIGIPNVSSPTSEQSTQTDDDENSSICSSTNSIKHFVIEPDDQMDEAMGGDDDEEGDVKECRDNGVADADFFPDDNARDGDALSDNATDKTVLLNIDDDDKANTDKAMEDEDDEEVTYCVGHYYGQNEEDDVPEKPPDVSKIQKDVTEIKPEEDSKPTNDSNSLQVNNYYKPPSGSKTPSPEPVATVSIPVPTLTKPFNLHQHPQHLQLAQHAQHAIPPPQPQIIGIAGIIAPQPSLQQPTPTPPASVSATPSHHHPHPHHQQQQQQQQQQQSAGNLLQPLHLASLQAHSAATVNQQISPNAGASTSGASTPIHHHHHCIHHPHVHLHSPGHQPSNAGAPPGASSVAGGAPGHPHTHIFPLQVISLAQAPGTAAAAAAGAATAWPLVEAPVYVDANGEYRTYCPAHPQGPPPREHRVLLQLDTGVSLPLQIAGKRKVFRGESLVLLYSFVVVFRFCLIFPHKRRRVGACRTVWWHATLAIY